MKIFYDFHIHTALSPCGDILMSPNNIVNMALLNQLDAIAITDHNTCKNCEAVMKVGEEKGLLVIPGIEIECMEEFHLVALFHDLKEAKYIEDIIRKHMPPINNRKDIFGNQYLLNEKDEIVGEEEQLLLTACQLSVYTITEKIKEIGAVIYPAHIDRTSYSIISNLGFLPEDLSFPALEISKNDQTDNYKEKYPNHFLLQSSDAHYLQDVSERDNYITADTLAIKEIFRSICTKS